MAETKVSIAGDYAVLEAGEFYFYYGYEHVWCRLHEKFADRCCDGEDSETEWAFTAKQNGQYIAKFRRAADIDEFNVEEQLIFGLGQFIMQQKEIRGSGHDNQGR